MRKILLSLTLLAGFASQANAADNYTATAGSGLTFAAKDNGSLVYFPRHIMCDNTTTTQCVAVDASGRITLVPNQSVNNAQWNGVALGSPSAYGTSPGAVNVPGVNAFVTNTLASITPGDAVATATYASGSPVFGATWLWNGTTYDRWKSAGATGIAGVRPTDGTRNAIIDPCEANLQTYAPISITTATTTRIVAPSASNKTYICSLFLTSAAADNVGIVEGTGGTCGTATAGVVGGTTAANGPNFAANGGVMLQAGGKVAVAQTAGTNVDLCLITSAATPLAGGIRYVQAP